MRILALIDGFNLFHALDGNDHFRQYKWLNLQKLIQCFLKKNDVLAEIYYFSALPHWSPSKVAKHRLYIRALENIGIRVILGEFKKKTILCQRCHQQFQTFEEKQTDMSIGMHLLGLAHVNRYDRAIIVSADTDLLPAIAAVHKYFSEKKVGMLFPIGRRKTHPLMRASDFYHRMREQHLIASQLNPLILLPDGTQIINPFQTAQS